MSDAALGGLSDRLEAIAQVESAERQLVSDALALIGELEGRRTGVEPEILPQQAELDERTLLVLGTVDTLGLLGCAGLTFEEAADRLVGAAVDLAMRASVLSVCTEAGAGGPVTQLLSELAPAQMPGADQLAGNATSAAAVRARPVVAALITALEAQAARSAMDRARALRLLGIPTATVGDCLDNEDVARILERNFEAAGSVNHMGVRHARAGDLGSALRLFGCAMALCPIHPEPPYNRAKTHRQLGDMDAALLDYETAYGVRHDDPEVANILRANGRLSTDQ